MTDQEQEARERQREAEQTALRKVRGTLDEIHRQEENQRKSKRRILLATPLIAVAFTAGAALLLMTIKRRRRAEPQYMEPEAHATAVRSRIARYIVVPAGVPDSAQAVVQISISENGDLVEMKIAQSSGFPDYDDAVRKAVSRAKSFPVLATQANVAKPSSVELAFRAK